MLVKRPKRKKPHPVENALPKPPLAPESDKPLRDGGDVDHRKPLRNVISDKTPMTVAFRHIRPSWRNYIEYVDHAARNGDVDMQRWRGAYLALGPRERKAVCPEQVCELANVTPGDLIGAVCKAIWEMKRNEASLISAIAQPVVFDKLAKAAEKVRNFKHTELFLRATGSLPDRHGQAVGAPVVTINQAFAPLVQQGASEDLAVVPSMDDDMIETSRALAPAQDEANVLSMRKSAEPDPVRENVHPE